MNNIEDAFDENKIKKAIRKGNAKINFKNNNSIYISICM